MDRDIQFSSSDKALFYALRKILTPLVRLLIGQKITYNGLQGLLKNTYVKVAEEHFTLEGKRQTDSRISLLTGVHRGDVKIVRSNNGDHFTEKTLNASLSAQIIAVWTGHQKYLDTAGNPRPLVRNATDGMLSFEALVLSVSKDKHPRSFIDEWLDQGIVEIKEEKGIEVVSLTAKGFIPEKSFEEKLFFSGKNIGNHLSVIVHNLEEREPPLFDRAVYYEQLSQSSIEELEALSKKKMLEALVEVNQKASELQERDQQLDSATYTMHLGAYFFHNNRKVNHND